MARTGRPPYVATKVQRDRVMRLRADGWNQERIARLLEIDVETLVKHFADELEHGADVKSDELLRHAERAAKKGNATLIKWLHERQTAARAAQSIDQRQEAPLEAQPKPEKLGKKELVQAAAEQIEGKFATPEAPKVH